MKTTRTTATPARGAALLAPLGDERGMLLVITMIVLLVISTLAAANLINAFLERSIAKNQSYANIALNAADAGIDAGIAWLGDPANRAAIPSNPVAWSRTGDPQIRTLPNGARYEVTITAKADDEDRDKDNLTSDIVQYNNVVPTAPQGNAANNGKFGYLDAKEGVAGQGYPVMTVRSKGSYGAAGYREISVDIARVKDIPPGVKGAVTSKDPVDFGASAAQAKDGRAHALNGVLCDGSNGTPSPPCDCNDQTNGLMVENGAKAGSDVGNVGTVFPVTGDGSGITQNPLVDAFGNPVAPLCSTAECVLGYSSRAALEAAVKTTNGRIFGPGAGETPINNATISATLESLPAGAIVIVRGSYQMVATTNVNATHAKRLVVDGTFSALGNTTFTGLLVAQNFDACGNLVVNGAAVVTGDGNPGTSPFANGTVTLNYSCDALAAAVGQIGYTIRLGWKREF